jgi:organic hydroperoxide reductase OsmC/OhrA
MAKYTAEVLWLRNEQDFISNRYSRKHLLRFDGGVKVAGSSSPHVVPLPMSDAEAIDPEEAFVASLCSCHMLWFLSIAAKRKFCVDRYFDAGVGTMGKNADGKFAMFPWSALGRAIANGRFDAVTKLLFDDSPEVHANGGHGKILGGAMLGTHAGDMIGEIALAIEMGADAVDIGKTIHPHPTLGESIGMAAEVAHGSCTDLPPAKK